MSDVRSESASPRIWLTKRMIDASSAALSRSPSSCAIVGDDLEAFLLFEQVERVRADAEVLLDLALQRLAGREHGLELEVGERLEAVQPRRGEQPAERDLDVPVFLAQRQHFLPQEDARRESARGSSGPARCFPAPCSRARIPREPLEHVLLRRAARCRCRRPSASASMAESWRLSTMRAASAARGSVSATGRGWFRSRGNCRAGASPAARRRASASGRGSAARWQGRAAGTRQAERPPYNGRT